jgi:hypothetical protein
MHVTRESEVMFLWETDISIKMQWRFRIYFMWQEMLENFELRKSLLRITVPQRILWKLQCSSKNLMFLRKERTGNVLWLKNYKLQSKVRKKIKLRKPRVPRIMPRRKLQTMLIHTGQALELSMWQNVLDIIRIFKTRIMSRSNSLVWITVQESL